MSSFVPLALFSLIGLLAYFGERSMWNGGICRASGERWRQFDTDSQGGRGYHDGCGNTCWISWPGIDR